MWAIGNGPAGRTYYVLTSTNVALPLADWAPVFTNVFDGGGSFSFTNVVDQAASPSFFDIYY